jgi:holo-[acyl-carrier protein] synthase
MKQAHIGTDIVEIARLEKARRRWGAHFLNRIYTAAEIRLCAGRAESLAARFAGKEAVMKALGGQGNGLNWKEIEILALPSGKPVVELSGETLGQSRALGIDHFEISLSHAGGLAVAFVIGV